MERSVAIATSGPQELLADVRPVEGVTLRSVERLLHEAGVHGTVARPHRVIYVRVDDLAEATVSGLEYSNALRERLDAIRRDANRHARARRVLTDVQLGRHARKMLDGFSGLDLLDEHQIVAVAAIAHPDIDGLCLFDEQGLGKTVSALFAFHRMRQTESCGKMLVFAPKSMVLEWQHDARRFFGDLYRCQPVTGNERAKRAACKAEADVYVTNYETAIRLSSRLRLMLMRDCGRALLVIDESFFVKNANALRTQRIRELRGLAGKCLVLCGTPAPNAPHDLVEQFNIADRGVTFRGVSVPEDREAARAVVSEAIELRGLYLRRLKARVLDLPGKTFNKVLVPLQPQQEDIYRGILLNLIDALRRASDLEFRKSIVSFMARRAAILQVCASPSAVVDGYRETPAKLLALDSMLQELVSRRREKVVVWSFYRSSLDAIWSRYQSYAPVRVDGSVSDPIARRDAVDRFQNDDETMLFVGNPAAAGAGITLHRARYAIYESMSNQAAHYLQSLDRIHRRGQRREVEYVVLLCTGTIEEREYERLLKKQANAEQLLGDDVDPPSTRQAMLREAVDAAIALGIPTDAGSP